MPLPTLLPVLLYALSLLLSAAQSSSAPNGSNVIYAATLSGVSGAKTAASGYIALVLVNSTYAFAQFNVSNISGMTSARIRSSSGQLLAMAYKSTLAGAMQPVTIAGTFSTTFAFDPSVANTSGLLAAGAAYFEVRTVRWPKGELRGLLTACSTGSGSGSGSGTAGGAAKRAGAVSAACAPGSERKPAATAAVRLGASDSIIGASEYTWQCTYLSMDPEKVVCLWV